MVLYEYVVREGDFMDNEIVIIIMFILFLTGMARSAATTLALAGLWFWFICVNAAFNVGINCSLRDCIQLVVMCIIVIMIMVAILLARFYLSSTYEGGPLAVITSYIAFVAGSIIIVTVATKVIATWFRYIT